MISNEKNLFTFHNSPFTLSGLTYMLARYYSQGYGTFISPDTFDLLGKINSLSSQTNNPEKLAQLETLMTNPLYWNKYIYCLDNPVNRVDKNGKFSLETAMFVAVSVAIAVGVYIKYKNFKKSVIKMEKHQKGKSKLLSEDSILNQDEKGSVGKKLQEMNKQFAEDAGELKNRGIDLMNSLGSPVGAPTATKEGEAAALLANTLKLLKRGMNFLITKIDSKNKSKDEPKDNAETFDIQNKDGKLIPLPIEAKE